MNQIENYFKRKTDNITFIELKDRNNIKIPGYPDKGLIPLPILTERLVSEIKGSNIEEEIDLSHLIDGIIYLLGIDRNFIYAKDYIEILNKYPKPIGDYIFYKGLKSLDEEDFDTAAIYFRALIIVRPDNMNGRFNYALSLEGLAQTNINKDKEEIGLRFLKEATKELETILDLDDKYALAYYKLGFHYKFLGYHLKAKLIWTKYLLLDKDDLRLQEIRGELETIEVDAQLETGITYLYREDYVRALDIFLKILPSLEKWWELNYKIGQAYKGLGNYPAAIEFLEKALSLNKEEGDLYNELAISLYLNGEIKEGISILSEGIDLIKDDYKLFFNRGLFYLELNKINEAYEDIEEAARLNPDDENIDRQLEVLDEIINN